MLVLRVTCYTVDSCIYVYNAAAIYTYFTSNHTQRTKTSTRHAAILTIVVSRISCHNYLNFISAQLLNICAAKFREDRTVSISKNDNERIGLTNERTNKITISPRGAGSHSLCPIPIQTADATKLSSCVASAV